VTAPPEGLVPRRQKRVADAEGGHAHRRPPTSSQGGCDPRAQDGRLERRRVRRAARAVLGLLRTWLHAGRLATHGRGIHPDTGVPHGGVGSPGCAHVSRHEAWARGVAHVGTPHGRGEAWSSRDADDCGCAWRFRPEAAGWSPVRPKRRGQGTREVALEQTRRRRCRRWHPGLSRRCTVVGGAWFWNADRPGGPRVTRRPARQNQPRAGPRLQAWRPATRPRPGHACCHGRTARRRGHARDAGVQGHAGARARVCDGALHWACTWRHRRGGTRQRVSGARVAPIWAANPNARPRLTAVRRRRVCAGADAWCGRDSHRGTGCGNTARPGPCGGRRVTGVPTAEPSKPTCRLLTRPRDGESQRSTVSTLLYSHR
jgi:hypothetical protein